MIRTEPGTPSRRNAVARAFDIETLVQTISEKHGLEISIPKEGQSPSARKSALKTETETARKADEVFQRIRYLYYRPDEELDNAVALFEREAEVLEIENGWVWKPYADNDVLPEGPERPSPQPQTRSIAYARRQKLLDVLINCLRDACNPLAIRPHVFLEPSLEIEVENARIEEKVDDRPIPLSLTQGKGKRTSNEFANDDSGFKKPKLPVGSSFPKVMSAVDSIPLKSFERRYTQKPAQFVQPPRNTTISRSNSRVISADLSMNSTFPSLFSQTTNSSMITTATSVNVSFEKSVPTPPVSSYAKDEAPSVAPSSSEYGSLEDEDYELLDSPLRKLATGAGIDDLDDEGRLIEEEEMPLSSQNVQQILQERLDSIFPEMPRSLQYAPFCIRYEITRVLLHMGVSIPGLQHPNWSKLLDYDCLWTFLKSLPELEGKIFPDRSSKNAWRASQGNFKHGAFEGVTLSATLRIRKAKNGPLLRLSLQPLVTNLSHRLGRRFGNDRFLEISIPNLSKIPLTNNGDENKDTRQEIIRWITHTAHQFLGREWKPFSIKDIKKRKATIELKPFEEETGGNSQMFFFAIDGVDFKVGRGLPERDEHPENHTKCSVQEMLNWLIPFEQSKNSNQPFLKLFSRITLGLSKTHETITLNYHEIKFKKDDLRSGPRDEVMNDGCGQISRTLARHIAQKLRLDYTPSGFQARIAGAKGYWIVDVKDVSDKAYIEIYPSQLKWEGRTSSIIEQLMSDPGHRTFEVLGWTKPATSAALNLQFIPILEDRGHNPKKMRQALSRLLENGLTHEIGRQRAAMDNRQAFRKWARDMDSGLVDRIKHGEVLYRAGLPIANGEKINLLLDSGFDPKKLRYLKDLAWGLYKSKCDVLQEKLNITVGRSAYLPMVVDFTGILEPDEVHIGFSSAFKDETTDFCDTILTDMDILVARSPAHYISDIQKVKAVFKTELSALKDVVVFSTKGDRPLAALLSGGDYDGDIAWVCWEQTLVNEFQNAPIPDCPDLIELGHIKKISTTYADLVSQESDPIPVFLEASFDFNLKPSLLGLCTNFKEKYCYTKGTYCNYEAVFLSTLLSSLVDQAKQGYIFDDDVWETIKRDVIRDKVREPNYKRETMNGTSCHIIDYLKFSVAKKVIDDTKTDFHKSLKHTSYWDEALVLPAKWARAQANIDPTMAAIMAKLDEDIGAIRVQWNKYNWGRDDDEEAKQQFWPRLNEIYPKWLAIQPCIDSPLSRSLTGSYFDAELSTWALLRASVLFSTYHHEFVSRLVWWLGGKQLCQLKAMSCGPFVPVIPSMYAMLKPDPTFVKLMATDEHDPIAWEARAESVLLTGEELVEYE